MLSVATGQFLMSRDTAVMNVSIATVASDVGTTVTGIQTAITLYTLVMASLMITGGKLGQILGRKRAFAIGCVIYGCGSLTTAIAPNLGVLLLGWSLLEGVGAALILPAGPWGFIRPTPAAPEWLGLSLPVWLILAGCTVLYLFVLWGQRRIQRGQDALIDVAILRNPALRAGLTSFFFQYLLQAGLF